MKRIKIYILLFLFGISLNYAQDDFNTIPDVVTKVATASGNWLKIETGTRAIGMGGAMVAFGDGIYAAPYNPAAIGFIDDSQAFFSTTSYIDGDTHSVTGYARRLSSTDHIGLHLYYFSSGDMVRRTVEVSDGSLGTFKFLGLNIRAIYTKTLTDRLKVGVSLKYIREMNWKAYWHAFAFDIGSNFDTGIYGLLLGMSVTNFGPEVQYRGDALTYSDPNSPTGNYAHLTNKFPLPLTFRLGLMKHIIGNDEKASIIIPGHRLTIAIDGINPIDYIVTSGLGMEYSWNEKAFARIGTHLGHSTQGFSIGGGVKFSRISVDYAYSDYGDLEATHQFGLGFDFGIISSPSSYMKVERSDGSKKKKKKGKKKTSSSGGIDIDEPEKPKKTGNAKIDAFADKSFKISEMLYEASLKCKEGQDILDDMSTSPPENFEEGIRILKNLGDVLLSIPGDLKEIVDESQEVLELAGSLPGEAKSLGFAKMPKALKSIKASSAVLKEVPDQVSKLTSSAQGTLEAINNLVKTMKSSMGNGDNVDEEKEELN